MSAESISNGQLMPDAELNPSDSDERPFDTDALVVPGYLCATDWLGQPPVIDPAQIVAVHDAQVVVVGSGHSGTQCALAAAEGGASVMVLEMQAEQSYTATGNDIATFNSEFLTQRGFGEYDLGQIIAEYIRRGGQAVNANLIRAYVQNSGEALDHIVELIPGDNDIFDFDNGMVEVQVAYDCPDHSSYPVELGGFKMWASSLVGVETFSPKPVCGRNVTRMTAMELYCREAAKAAGAQWFYQAEGQVLVQNEQGDVTGVIAKTPNGYEQFNASKGVVLATGDFSGNIEMVLNLIDIVNEMDIRGDMPQAQVKGFSGLEGTGHKMGCWAGGAIESHPRASLASIMANPGPWGTSPLLMLNSQGKRFMNEANGPFAKIAMLHQPHGLVCNITDANYFDSMKVAGCDHGAPIFGTITDQNGHMGDFFEGMKAAVDAGAEGAEVKNSQSIGQMWRSRVFAAQTLEQLLDYLGYEGQAKQQALQTIQRYNELCHQGCDVDFGKDAKAMIPVEKPPFFGSVREETGTTSVSLVTLCGLVTDDDMNVMKMDGSGPIKGLYCVGNVLGNRFGMGYNVPQAGTTMGIAVTHGRVLGKHLASL